MLLEEFNALADDEARATVLVWAAVPAWADALIEARPYTSADDLAAAAAAGAARWTAADLDAALAHHPRIGERPRGGGAEAEASRSEQSSMSSAADDVAAAIAAGNADYERRFGRVFLIRAAGRSPDEMLVELNRRLDNDDAAEAAEATDQLAQIAVLRLRSTVTDAAPAARGGDDA